MSSTKPASRCLLGLRRGNLRRFQSSQIFHTTRNPGFTSIAASSRFDARTSLKSAWIHTKIIKHIPNRRAFSVTSAIAHGHITPPKAGEEYVEYKTLFITKSADFILGSTSHLLTKTVMNIRLQSLRVITYWILLRKMILKWKVVEIVLVTSEFS
jgi:hypothetical protein